MRERMRRLDEFMKTQGLNDNQVTIQCGLSKGLIGQARTGRSDIGEKSVDKILKTYHNLSRVWFLTGEGDMLTDQPTSSSAQATAVASTVSSFSHKTLEEHIAELEHQNAVLTRSLDLLTRQLEALLAERQKNG